METSALIFIRRKNMASNRKGGIRYERRNEIHYSKADKVYGGSDSIARRWRTFGIDSGSYLRNS